MMPGAQVRCLADVEPEEVLWHWTGRIPRGKLVEMFGLPGVGKSTLITGIVAHLTTGNALPGDESGADPINVLLLNGEDGVADTIRPRLDKAGADVDCVFHFDGIGKNKDELQHVNLRDEKHLARLTEEIKNLDVGLVVIDPIDAYLGDIDSYKNSQVRGLLSPLAKIAEEQCCTILNIRHPTKAIAERVVNQAGGSVGFTAAARCSMLVGAVDEDSDERAIVVIKSNLAVFPPSVGFTITDEGFAWSDELPDVTASDLLRPDSTSEERTDKAEAMKWLQDLLAKKPMPANEIYQKAAHELHVSATTIKRAKKALRGTEYEIESLRESEGSGGKGQWLWSMSPRGPTSSEPLGDSESEPLGERPVNKGLSASKKSNGLQEGHLQGGDPLAEPALVTRTDDDEEYLQDERRGMRDH